jgi:hypothetical protein
MAAPPPPTDPFSDERRFHPRSLAPLESDEAGCFDYSATPSVFLGRSGLGPLRLAWETNLLIDWRDLGATLLADDRMLPAGLDPTHEEELAALGALMNTIYTTRDVRVYPLRRQLRDFGRNGRRRFHRRIEERGRQLDEVASALWCVGLVGEFHTGHRGLPLSSWRAHFMKPSADRLLVEEAITRGCHVFLTRDKKILKHGESLARLGLGVMPASDCSTQWSCPLTCRPSTEPMVWFAITTS